MKENNNIGSAYFIEMWRWFTEKLTNFSKDHDKVWVDSLKESYVYVQEFDEFDKPTGNWYGITGLSDHGPNVTLKVRKINGKINV